MLKLKKIQSEKIDMVEEGRRYLPTLYLDSKQVPEIKDWEVGETYHVILELRQTSKNENDTEKDGKVNSVSAQFDIVAYKPMEMEKDMDEMTDEEIEEMQGKVMGGHKK